MLVFFADERSLRDEDIELARHLAGAARGALERSGLFEGERTSRALAQQLARTGSALATELDPAAVLDEVVQQAPELLGADACAIRIVDGDELLVTAVAGSDAEVALGVRSETAGWLSGEVAQSRKAVAVPDASSDAALLASDAVLAAGYSAYLGVPLVGPESSLLGVIAVYARDAAALAAGRGRGAARARGEHRGRALERRALPARRTREGAQHGDPREHRGRDRRASIATGTSCSGTERPSR